MKMLMQRFLIRYSMYYNSTHKRTGHLFQNRYKSILCEDDPYLKELVRYIHLNPLRAGLVESYGDLSRYQWCGHGVLLGNRKEGWQDTDSVLEEFGNARASACKAYGKYVREGVDKGRRSEFSGGGLVRSMGGIMEVMHAAGRREKMQSDERILGGGEYVAKILREVERRDRRKTGLKERITPEEIIEQAANVVGVDARHVYMRNKSRDVSQARSLAAKWLVEDLGMTVGSAARMLKVTPAAVCYGVQKGKDVELTRGISLVFK